jgi:polyphosphate glucokinase
MHKRTLKPSGRGKSPSAAPHTLAIDIGGTHLKASVLDRLGAEIVAHREVETPHPGPPNVLLPLLESLVHGLPAYDRVSAGFPGVVRRGRILTAPNLGTAGWRGFRLAADLARRFGRPARVLNDAEVQGFGVIRGKGLECVVTLGTGVGSAVYRDGELMPHLELGQHPIDDDKTYDKYLGAAALRKHGVAKWNRRVRRMIKIVQTLLNYDRLYLGGGNASKIRGKLPPDTAIVSNEAGITGGAKLWQPELDRFF